MIVEINSSRRISFIEVESSFSIDFSLISGGIDILLRSADGGPIVKVEISGIGIFSNSVIVEERVLVKQGP